MTTKKIANGAVTGAKIAKGTITARQININALGTVPSATNASHASDADELGSNPASAYQGKILWARVALDGTLTAGSGATSSGLLQTGQYDVTFNRARYGMRLRGNARLEPGHQQRRRRRPPAGYLPPH